MSAGLDLKWIGDDDLIGLMEQGPEDLLTTTINAQKAVFSVTAALWESSVHKQPAMVMGHSLGEYMALVASRSISREDCFRLISERASAMDRSMPPGSGVMAAVLGMAPNDIQEALKDVEGMWVANYNMPGQTVISGDTASFDAACARLKDKGARRIIPLNVAIASHCPRMEPAARTLAGRLKDVDIRKPETPVVFNVTAEAESDPERIRTLLADQLVSPVQWERSVRYAAEKGIDRFIEIGPKSVLAPMVKKILPGIEVEVITNDGH